MSTSLAIVVDLLSPRTHTISENKPYTDTIEFYDLYVLLKCSMVSRKPQLNLVLPTTLNFM